MEGSSKQRYKEDKKLWDIVNDMGYGEANIEKNILRSMQSERFSKELIKIITTHTHKVDKFEAEYKNTSDIIHDIEHFYYREKRHLNRYKTLIDNHNSGKTADNQKKSIMHDIHDHAFDIQDELDAIEKRRQTAYRKLVMLAKKFPDEEDKTSHIKKTNDFWRLFQDIYDDIVDIDFAQQQLVKKIKH